MSDSPSYVLPLLLNLVRYFLLAGIPFLIFYILFPRAFSNNKIQARLAKQKDFIREITHSLQTTLILAAVGILILQTPLRAYTQLYTNLSDYPRWWVPLSILLSLILHDTYFYWMHRTVHHPRLYRRVHLVHHQSVNPSPWASYSFHFFEGVLEALVAPLILLLIPMHPLSLFLFTLASFSINVYGHLGYEIAPRWFRHSWLFELLNTSTHHNLHHAQFRGNYGLYFRFWDRLMGTEHPDYVREYDKIQARRFGPAGGERSWWQGVWGGFFVLVLGGLTVAATVETPSIEGQWTDPETGAVVAIYEADGLYFGRLIEGGHPADNEKLRAHGELVWMKNFERSCVAEYCCGTIWAPKRRKTIAARLILEDGRTLRIEGSSGWLKGQRIFKRVDPAAGVD